MPVDLWRIIIVLAVAAHGIGHTMFMPVPIRAWLSNGHSWLLTGTIGDAPTKALAYVLAAVSLVLFVAGAYGFAMQLGWWRPALQVGAAASAVLIVAMFDGLPPINAIAALAFDVVVVVAIQANWPSGEVLGG